MCDSSVLVYCLLCGASKESGPWVRPTKGPFSEEAEFYKALELTEYVHGAKREINLCFSEHSLNSNKEGKSSCIRVGFFLTTKAQ